MTAPKVVGGQTIVYPRSPDTADDHSALLDWEQEQDALRAPIGDPCTCWHPDLMESFPEHCDVHRASA